MLDRALGLLGGALWGWHVLLLILAAGASFSYSSAFFQLRGFGRWMGAALGRGQGKGRFRAIATALAGSIGTGNIVGVATALTAGAPMIL